MLNTEIESIHKTTVMGKEFTILGIKGEPWMFKSEVVEALGYKYNNEWFDEFVSDYCTSELPFMTIVDGEFVFEKIISERDVYRLILESEVDSADSLAHHLLFETVPLVREIHEENKGGEQ